jgi:hypothetical protein
MIDPFDHCRSFALLVAALAFVMPGCTGRPDYRSIKLTDASGLPLSAIPSVEVENGRGTVTVEIDPRITEPRVIGNVYPEPGSTKTVREDATQGSTFSAEVVQTDGRPVVRVHGAPPESQGAAVEITVRLPACWGVTVHNAGGAVRLVGVAGPIVVENGAGGGPGGMVIVRTGETMTDAVTLTTTSGDIYYQIPPSSTGKMDLLSLDGEAELRAQGGRLTEVVPTYSWYRGVLNAGQNLVTLRSGKGMVRVTVLDHAGKHVPAE